VAVSPDGLIFVADSGNHRIQVFNPEGEFIRTWGSFGSEPGTFNEPWGLAVDDEFIYVADTWNHRIQKFDHQGNLLRVIGQSGSPSAEQDGGGLFFGPRDIVILNDGNILVTDTGNHRLQVFDPEGNFLYTEGAQGIQPGQFYEPVGLGYSPSETIYVVDTWNGRIQELTTDLFPLNSWQVDAWFGESINNKPYVAIDDQDRLYVSDPEGYRILVFGSNGQYLGRFGQYALDSSGFGLPNGLAVDQEGYLYIADGGNNQILKYAPFPNGPFPDDPFPDGPVQNGPDPAGLDLDQSQDSSGEIESP
jgi:sugar lactone lactonase YvrE